MKLDTLVSRLHLPVLTIIALIAPHIGAASDQDDVPQAAAQEDKKNYDYYSNNGNQQPDYNDYSDNQQPSAGDRPDLEYSIECYACSYIVTPSNIMGNVNCADPFSPVDVPAVDCKHPCAKVFEQTAEDDYTMHRICMKDCKENRDAQSYTECCTSRYCNSAQAQTASYLTQILTGLAALLLSHWLRCR